MITEIGVVSGEILAMLEDKNQSLTITDIDKQLDKPKEIITMSVGYLAREGIVKVKKSGDNYVVNEKL